MGRHSLETQLSLRVPPTFATTLDGLVKLLRDDPEWAIACEVTRMRVLRHAVLRGLDEMDAARPWTTPEQTAATALAVVQLPTGTTRLTARVPAFLVAHLDRAVAALSGSVDAGSQRLLTRTAVARYATGLGVALLFRQWEARQSVLATDDKALFRYMAGRADVRAARTGDADENEVWPRTAVEGGRDERK